MSGPVAGGQQSRVGLAGLMSQAGGDGWRLDDPAVELKLQGSVRRLGQLRPVVVRRRPGGDGLPVIVDGRRLVAAMSAAGHSDCWVVDLGTLTDAEAAVVRLSLELRFAVDYVGLAHWLLGLMKAGEVTAQQLAQAGPWGQDRLEHLESLAVFDWSAYSDVQDGQVEIDWSAVEQQAEPEAGEPPAAPRCACDAEGEAPAPEAPPASAPKRKAVPQLSLWD